MTHQKEKYPFEQRHQQDQEAVEQNAERKNVIHIALQRYAIVEVINVQRFDHQVERVTHELRRDNAEKIGYDRKNDTQNEVPFIFPQILVKGF